MYPSISRQDLGAGDLVWCATATDRERWSPEALGITAAACRQGEAVEWTDGRRVSLYEIPAYFKQRGVRRIVLHAEPCPDQILRAGLPVVRLQPPPCGEADFMAPEDSEEVAQRLRELGYL